MINLYLKKGLAVGVICLLVLVAIPMVSGECIFYPREEGPYNVFISGECGGMGGRFFTQLLYKLHFWPLWFLYYPDDINWHFQPGSVFFVNGEKQDIVYPAHIWLYGFKGYQQSYHMFQLKEKVAFLIGVLTDSMPTTRARIIGRCDEIQVSDSA